MSNSTYIPHFRYFSSGWRVLWVSFLIFGLNLIQVNQTLNWTLEIVFEFEVWNETSVREVVKTSMYRSEWFCRKFCGKLEYQVVLSPVIIRDTDRYRQEVLFNIAKTSFHLLLENNNNSSSADRQCNIPGSTHFQSGPTSPTFWQSSS